MEQALIDSIKAWEQKLERVDPMLISIGISSCPLCTVYRPPSRNPNKKCQGCPIARATGQDSCQGTPYIRAWNALARWQSRPMDETLMTAWRSVAQEMIDFMKRLGDD